MLGQLRTFIFTTQYDTPFGIVFTTARELETYIKHNIPPEFNERLLIKPNKSVPGGKDYRLKTLIREFDKKYPMENKDILFISSEDEGFQELLNHNFCDESELDVRVADEPKKWLMLIPKNKALAYIRQVKEFDKYIETTDERIPVSGRVHFTRPPIKPYTQAVPLIPIEKKVEKVETEPTEVESMSDTEYAMMYKRKTKGSAKKSKKKEGIKALRFGTNRAISFRKENWLYLGKPSAIELHTFPEDEPGVLYIGNGGKDGIFKAFEINPKTKKRRYTLSIAVRYIRDKLEAPMGKSIERGCYYSAEQVKREVDGKLSKWVRIDFNIMVKKEK